MDTAFNAAPDIALKTWVGPESSCGAGQGYVLPQIQCFPGKTNLTSNQTRFRFVREKSPKVPQNIGGGVLHYPCRNKHDCGSVKARVTLFPIVIMSAGNTTGLYHKLPGSHEFTFIKCVAIYCGYRIWFIKKINSLRKMSCYLCSQPNTSHQCQSKGSHVES